MLVMLLLVAAGAVWTSGSWLVAAGLVVALPLLLLLMVAVCAVIETLLVIGSSGRGVWMRADGSALLTWQLVDGEFVGRNFVAWPIGEGRFWPVLERFCVAADEEDRVIVLTATNRVVGRMYEAYGFVCVTAESVKMRRLPVPVS